ncbi:MAG: hypothetical protein OXC13_15815 [Caldilineaceae bacterium]|nr:hypothetical protein [Caldilineaceae bacterium]
MAARRTRVERAWLDLLETSYADLFEHARVDSEADAELIGEGMAFAWVAWYKAQAKPVRRRNLILLMEHLRMPSHIGEQVLRLFADDEGRILAILQTFAISYTRTMWREHRGEAATGTEPSDIDWSEWSGPGLV